MKKLSGKNYDNKLVTLLNILLRNAKWILLVIILGNALFLFEDATSHGLDDETTFWSIVSIVVLVILFVFNKTWMAISDKITDLLGRTQSKNAQ